MRKRVLKNVVALAASVAMVLSLAGCGGAVDNSTATTEETITTTISETEESVEITSEAEVDGEEEKVSKIDLEDGLYLAKFDTDSSMFHVNETMNGLGVLTVENGEASIHLVLTSKNIVNLYFGVVADAENDEANWLMPTPEEVTYEDGMTEEVNAFDVPVPVIGEEFDLALLGKKGTWYDHKVSVSDPQPATDGLEASAETEAEEAEGTDKTIEVSLEGGTGKVSLITPTVIKKEADGYLVTLEWSSKNYDYMIVDDVKYLPVEVNEHSIFEIPVKSIDEPLNVIADTVAMSKPHEIEYVITFDANTLK